MATATEDTGNDNKMFGPLVFEELPRSSNQLQLDSEVTCLLCDNIFNIDICFDIFVKHLFEVHNIVIEDIQNIENIPKLYISYWRDKFKATPVKEIVPSLKTNLSHCYFLLSTLLKEDKELRHKLRLEYVLKVQEFERRDENYTTNCFFCKENFKGTRTGFVEHLTSQHHLQLGNPQNLVYIEDLIEKIDNDLNKLTCIYCKRIFPERFILKEHMRKKFHKRLNPYNTAYDKYFIVNYLELDTSSRQIQKQNDELYPVYGKDNTNDDEEYWDWSETEDLITCLFCNKKEAHLDTLCLHMEADHSFDFLDLTKDFDFYQKVKLINYVRKQTHHNKCFYCSVSHSSSEILQKHLFQEQHCKIPDMKLFDQPEYYFSTYENDALLYLIDDLEKEN